MNAGTETGRDERGRIVIAASSYADASSGVRLAALLAARFEADLEGIFVEEETGHLLRSPSARIVSATGSLLALPSTEELRAALKRDALAFEQEIARLAQSRSRMWSFRTLQGRLFALLGDVLQGHDILLLGHRPLYRLRGPVLRLGPSARPDVAASLAADLGVPLVDIAFVEGETAEAAAVEELLSRIGRLSASAVVADTRSDAVRTPARIEHLLDAARCPVVLVGAPPSGDR